MLGQIDELHFLGWVVLAGLVLWAVALIYYRRIFP